MVNTSKPANAKYNRCHLGRTLSFMVENPILSTTKRLRYVDYVDKPVGGHHTFG